jgi:hypothetical protein
MTSAHADDERADVDRDCPSCRTLRARWTRMAHHLLANEFVAAPEFGGHGIHAALLFIGSAY